MMKNAGISITSNNLHLQKVKEYFPPTYRKYNKSKYSNRNTYLKIKEKIQTLINQQLHFSQKEKKTISQKSLS